MNKEDILEMFDLIHDAITEVSPIEKRWFLRFFNREFMRIYNKLRGYEIEPKVEKEIEEMVEKIEELEEEIYGMDKKIQDDYQNMGYLVENYEDYGDDFEDGC